MAVGGAAVSAAAAADARDSGDQRRGHSAGGGPSLRSRAGGKRGLLFCDSGVILQWRHLNYAAIKWRPAGSTAVAAGGRDNGNQGRGRDLVEKLDYPFGFFFAQELDLA